LRYVIYGAGAVGGVIGAKLFMHGKDVVLIARGDHLRAIQKDGLRLDHPDDSVRLFIPAVSHPSEVDFREDDVVLLAMKAQDTLAALTELRGAAGETVAVVSCQNGVINEPQALRFFPRVYGVCVFLPAGFLQPGLVDASAWPVSGALDIGRYPEGIDAVARAIAHDFSSSGFTSQPTARIMRAKYGKLYQNVGNAVQAVCGRKARVRDLIARLRAEAEACFAAARIDWARPGELADRDAAVMRRFLANRSGNSTTQSLVRATGTSEVDYLNGEIVFLGRLHGVATPANEAFQDYGNRLAREKAAPGSVSAAEMRREIARRAAAPRASTA